METLVHEQAIESLPVPAPGSFDAFYREYKDAVYAYARTLGGDEGEDLMAEAFIRCWKRLSAGEPVDNPVGYLVLAVRHLYLDRLRRRRRETQRLAVLGEARAARAFPAPDERLGRVEEEARIRTAVAALPDSLREVLVLYVWSGLTFPEIARVTGLSVGTVFSRYRQALAELQRGLQDGGEGEGSR